MAFISSSYFSNTTVLRRRGSVCSTFTGRFSASQRCLCSGSRTELRRFRVVASASSEKGPAEVREVPFEIRGFSLANLALAGGLLVTGTSFYSYFSSYGTASGSSLGFVYGVPILLVGCALKYAELKPVPLTSTADGRRLRTEKATTVLRKVVADITRHRYGDEAHLAPALSSLGLVPRGAACPQLLRATETGVDGQYALGLEFASTETPWRAWEEKREKCERFFGPGVRAEVRKLDEEKRLVELKLITI